jgi:hypothetical protein
MRYKALRLVLPSIFAGFINIQPFIPPFSRIFLANQELNPILQKVIKMGEECGVIN